MSFWGLILEPSKRYSKTIDQPFHISLAAVDLHNSNGKPVQVILSKDDKNFLLCTLNSKKGPLMQCPLDLNLQAGEKVTFTTNGSSHVHLTGYLIEEFDDDDLGDEQLDADYDESDVDAPELISPKEAKALKRKADTKKKKKAELSQTESSEDEDSDDSDAQENGQNTSDNESEAETSDEDSEPVPKKKKNKLNGEVLKEKETKKEKKAKNESPKDVKPVVKTIEGGVQIKDLRVGTGVAAKSGKFVGVYYVGRLKSNNKCFDSHSKGSPFKFRVGKGEVIKGWDVALNGMRVGGKRQITCPPSMAYGAKGAPPAIPPNSTLVFEVELKNVQ